jgi:imidazolonepropionase
VSDAVFTGITELFTPARRIEDAALAVRNGRVEWAGRASELPGHLSDLPREDQGGRGVLPGLVDCHTHLVWAGDRLDEFVLRSRGASYEEILEAGGGIHNTVRATVAASEDELLDLARERARILLGNGVTTLEVKSGYGLEPAAELKMLRVARRLTEEGPWRIEPTLLAHVVPPGAARADHVERFCSELIPEVARERLAGAVDVFCDRGAFTLDETRAILKAALANGLRVKAHAEQLEWTGATRLVCELGGLSADHLERTGPEDWAALAASGTVGVVLPGATVLLRKRFPDVRAMLETGVKVAVATDHNPGSSPFYNLFLALQLAMALGGLTAEEALAAGTTNAAAALGRPDLGRLEPGAAADFLVVDSAHALEPLYRHGHTPLAGVYVAGRRAA